MVAVTAGPGPPGHLGLLTDEISGAAYLVDSGAAYSVLLHSSVDLHLVPYRSGGQFADSLLGLGRCVDTLQEEALLLAVP